MSEITRKPTTGLQAFACDMCGKEKTSRNVYQLVNDDDEVKTLCNACKGQIDAHPYLANIEWSLYRPIARAKQ